MTLILASWKTLWVVWDVRLLVLFSLTLQIILFVFGKRRKNMSSQWINVIVWLAYIMADWVATVALGKLSYAQNNIPNPNNALQALWAPLLLLHLGGPDTITAYSLEDNQLWIRHFLDMGVQATVAIYVIVMSWRHFWFSFMLIPAFVAGIIKYGERTWALKLACHGESRKGVPFYHDVYHLYTVGLARPIKLDERDDALGMACVLVREFKDYIESYDIGRYQFMVHRTIGSLINCMNAMNLDDDTCIGDILEVEMGLMYDVLYTKAPITFTKIGCIFRSISFMCTVSVLVGLFRLIAMEAKWNELHYSMVDIVITGVLLAGALALEIYAVILLLFSDWAMLWLIKCGRGKWAIRLWQKFPWFFEKKKWSEKMGQIDLFEEEDKRPKWRRIPGFGRFGRFGIQYEFNRYMHSNPGTLYPMIIQFIYRVAATDNLIDLGGLERFFSSTAFHHQIIVMHVITDILYRFFDDTSKSQSDLESVTGTSENSANSCGHHDDKEKCKTLSKYMMYLLLTCRSLLPVVVSDFELANSIFDARERFRHKKRQAREKGRKWSPSDMTKKFIELDSAEVKKFLNKDVIIELVDEGNKEVKWAKLKMVWLGMLCYAAISGPKNYHLQKLREGGELLNLVWFLIPQSCLFYGVNTFALNNFFKKYFQSRPDV